jgi:hypothetical protein
VGSIILRWFGTDTLVIAHTGVGDGVEVAEVVRVGDCVCCGVMLSVDEWV